MSNNLILVIDDEKEILDLLCSRLKKQGYNIISSTNGKEAIEMAKNNLPALILADIVLQDIDGPEIVKKLQLDPAAKNIPVIFLSGIVSNNNANNFSEVNVGGKIYTAVGKPFIFEDLITEINKYIKIKQ